MDCFGSGFDSMDAELAMNYSIIPRRAIFAKHTFYFYCPYCRENKKTSFGFIPKCCCDMGHWLFDVTNKTKASDVSKYCGVPRIIDGVDLIMNVDASLTTKNVGIGILFRTAILEFVWAFSHFEPKGNFESSNMAEMCTLLVSLEMLKMYQRSEKEKGNDIKNVIIYMDSKCSVEAFYGRKLHDLPLDLINKCRRAVGLPPFYLNCCKKLVIAGKASDYEPMFGSLVVKYIPRECNKPANLLAMLTVEKLALNSIDLIPKEKLRKAMFRSLWLDLCVMQPRTAKTGTSETAGANQRTAKTGTSETADANQRTAKKGTSKKTAGANQRWRGNEKAIYRTRQKLIWASVGLIVTVGFAAIARSYLPSRYMPSEQEDASSSDN